MRQRLTDVESLNKLKMLMQDHENDLETVKNEKITQSYKNTSKQTSEVVDRTVLDQAQLAGRLLMLQSRALPFLAEVQDIFTRLAADANGSRSELKSLRKELAGLKQKSSSPPKPQGGDEQKGVPDGRMEEIMQSESPRVAKLESACHAANIENEKLCEKLHSAEGERKDLQDQLTKMKSANSSLEESRTSEGRRCAELESKLSDLIAASSSEKQHLEAELEKLSGEFQAELLKVQMTNTEALQQDKDAERAARIAAEAELERVLQEHEAEMKAVQLKISEALQTGNDIERAARIDAESELEKVLNKLQAVETEKQGLLRSGWTIQAQTAEVVELEVENQNLTRENQQREELLSDMQLQLQEAMRSHEENKAVLLEKHDRLHAQYATLEHKFEAEQAKSKNFEENLHRLSGEREHLEQQYKDTDKHLQDAKIQLTEALRGNDDREDALRAKEEEKSMLQVKIENMQQTVEEHEKAVAPSLMAAAAAEFARKDLANELVKVKHESMAMSQELLDTTSKQKLESDERVRAISEERDERVRVVTEQFVAENQRLKLELDLERSRLDAVQLDMQKMQGNHQHDSKALGEVRKQLDEALSEMMQQGDTIVACTREIQNLRAELEVEQHKRVQVEAQKREAFLRSERAEWNLRDSEMKLNSTTANLVECEKMLNALKTERAATKNKPLSRVGQVAQARR